MGTLQEAPGLKDPRWGGVGWGGVGWAAAMVWTGVGWGGTAWGGAAGSHTLAMLPLCSAAMLLCSGHAAPAQATLALPQPRCLLPATHSTVTDRRWWAPAALPALPAGGWTCPLMPSTW